MIAESKNEELIGVCAPKGFRAIGISGGIKPAGKLDTAVIISDTPAKAAGVFTSNVIKAASVQISQTHLKSSEHFRAIVITSGNANAATGKQGLEAANSICAQVAETLKCTSENVLIAQTGLIGKTLDGNVAASGAAKAAQSATSSGGRIAAQAIMTTDTVPKLAAERITIGGKAVTLGAMAKGAAMLSPSMATMIGAITSDIAASSEVLQAALANAMDDSFHSLIVDGCRSTNDTVFLLANGQASNAELTSLKGADFETFSGAVKRICVSLASQMARDAEGATKFLTVQITGARTTADARLAARGVCSSLLVKCSLAGEVPYWGRVISELGASGADFLPEDVEIRYGNHLLCKQGIAHDHDEAGALQYMKGKDIVISASLGSGSGKATMYGCDLTHAYVDENMGAS